METQFNKGIETQGKSEIEVNLDMGNSIRLKKKKNSQVSGKYHTYNRRCRGWNTKTENKVEKSDHSIKGKKYAGTLEHHENIKSTYHKTVRGRISTSKGLNIVSIRLQKFPKYRKRGAHSDTKRHTEHQRDKIRKKKIMMLWLLSWGPCLYVCFGPSFLNQNNRLLSHNYKGQKI